MTPSAGIEPGTLWWKTSALTSAPFLLLQYDHSSCNMLLQHGRRDIKCTHSIISIQTIFSVLLCNYTQFYFVITIFSVLLCLHQRGPGPFSFLFAFIGVVYNSNITNSTNHCVQSSEPMTTRLNWQSTNSITSLTNHINDQSIYTTYWRYTNHLTSDDDFRSGCRNVSQCHLKQSFSGLHSPGRSYFT